MTILTQLLWSRIVWADRSDPLHLPFHFSWDTNAAVEDAGVQKMPQGNGSAEKVVVKYPSDGGYSPGDTWELYVGSDGRVEEMAYHRGGSPKLKGGCRRPL